MKILLDENMPAKLAAVLRKAGHDVATVQSLKLAGIDNGALLALAGREYDLCFTKDADFGKRAREARSGSKLKVLNVKLTQQRQDGFIQDFMAAFLPCDFSQYTTGSLWP